MDIQLINIISIAIFIIIIGQMKTKISGEF